MSDTVIARRYAKALFDLAASQSKVVKFQDQLQRLSQAGEALPDLWTVLADEREPMVKRVAIVNSLGDALQLDPLVVNFCKILVEKHRIGSWASISTAFAQLAAKAAGLVKVEVTTAVPVASKETIDHLSQALTHLTKKTVDMQMSVNDALIGGAVVRIDDTIYDGSIATDLRRLKDKLKEAAL